ncbi:MAG TPA: hypothetical protein DEO88_14735, partial [Syntrophobacteraceae bacterium]|nr:hypothetical protein [Syntrophobacteraceae bacterium]
MDNTSAPPCRQTDPPLPCLSQRPAAKSAFLAISVAGFAGTVAQILMVRELLVLYYGNELSSGLVFSSWLLWTALGSALGGLGSGRARLSAVTLALVLSLLALSLPATLLWVRASRILWGIPLGELVPPGKMLIIALTATAPFCTTNGLLFALAWAVQAGIARRRGESLATDSGTDTELGGAGNGGPTRKPWGLQPLVIYLGEAAGAALGGLCLYFVLLPSLSVLTTTLVDGLLLWLAASLLLAWSRKDPLSGGRFGLVGAVWLLAGFAVLSGCFQAEALDRLSRRWQWGPDLVAGYDTPYHHLSLFRRQNQISVFANGLWWFSAPDPQTAEYSVHIALLEHPEPRQVLLVGSGIAGLAGEILKHPTVARIDYIEADPQVVPLVGSHLPREETAPLDDPRVRLHHVDATSFLRQCAQRYDVVILHCGDPMNLQTNRFYTVEFYRRIAKVLNPGGLVAFAVGASADLVGAVQARFLKSLRTTLRVVFAEVMIFPGETARFLACNQAHRLTTDPKQLVGRLQVRGLHLRYVREDTLEDALDPLRLTTLAAALDQRTVAGSPPQPVPVNWDFQPICYFQNLLLWAAQLHGNILQGLLTLQRYQAAWLWSGVLIQVLIVLCLMNRSWSRPGAAVGFNVLLVGGV